ncbi:E3 ubiquitin-protein ligase TRIM58, partial [Manis javanica]
MELKTMCHIPGMWEMLRKFQGNITQQTPDPEGSIPVDVKLDPSTAHPSILLTTYLHSVQVTELW